MKDYLNAIKWEAILDFKEYARYRIGLLMDFIVFTGTFIAIYYLGISDGFTSFYNISENQGKILVLIGLYLLAKLKCSIRIYNRNYIK